MGGWRRQYGEFAGPRYPSLIAYAQLLAGDRTRADALAEHALRRTFGKRGRLGTDGQVEAEIRRQIVARFLATAEPEGTTDGGTALAADPVSEPPQPAAPATQPEVDPSLYAPPGESASQTFELLHTAGTGVADGTYEDSHESHEPQQSHVCAEVEKSTGPEAESEQDQTQTALGALSPRARAITVLRHYDGLAPGLIAEQLGLSPADISQEIRASHETLRARLGITIADEPDRTVPVPGDGTQQVMVTPHAGSR